MKTSTNHCVPNGLRKCRKEAGLMQKDVANLLHLKSPSIVCRWERGVCYPNLQNALLLSLLYRTVVDNFYLDVRSELKDGLRQRRSMLEGGKR